MRGAAARLARDAEAGARDSPELETLSQGRNAVSVAAEVADG